MNHLVKFLQIEGGEKFDIMLNLGTYENIKGVSSNVAYLLL